MEILSVNADQKLVNMASAIGRNPQSWDGWFCLEIKLQDVEDDFHQDCLIWTKSILDSYFKDTQGRAYFCDNKDIHILCKVESPKRLHQTGQQICDLIYAENALAFHYNVHDLAENGYAYAQDVLTQIDALFSRPAKSQDTPKSKTLPLTPSSGTTKVLLIEDDPVARWMVQNALKNECEFTTASTVNQAFGMYSACQPDVVFLDINLPDGSGYAVLEWIMRNDPGACVVMFSGNDNLDNIASALEDGASGFIAKPFLKESLLHYIHNHTG